MGAVSSGFSSLIEGLQTGASMEALRNQEKIKKKSSHPNKSKKNGRCEVKSMSKPGMDGISLGTSVGVNTCHRNRRDMDGCHCLNINPSVVYLKCGFWEGGTHPSGSQPVLLRARQSQAGHLSGEISHGCPELTGLRSEARHSQQEGLVRTKKAPLR